MKNKIYIAAIILSISSSLKSQDQEDNVVYFEKNITYFNFLPLGITHESHITNHASILFDFGTGFYIEYISNERYNDINFNFVPYFALEPRIYTNLQERELKGKSTDYHSGAYGSLRLQYGFFAIKSDEWYLQFGPLVGFQKAFDKNGYWNIGIGCGTSFGSQPTHFGLIANFKLGIIIK